MKNRKGEAISMGQQWGPLGRRLVPKKAEVPGTGPGKGSSRERALSGEGRRVWLGSDCSHYL